MSLSRTQRAMQFLLPKQWFESAKTASQNWIMHCSKCSATISVWDAGGIRWLAKGQPRKVFYCQKCGGLTWDQLIKQPSTTAPK